ncbi:MAG: hypothetical protein ACERKO_01425 [Acetanaerobacterium sp.]
MRHKATNPPDHSAKKQRLSSIVAPFTAALLFLAAACYALISAATLSYTLYDAVAQHSKTVSAAVFDSLTGSYNDDLRTLHLDVEAQDVHFDELAEALTAAARQNGFVNITTISPRGTGYVNILDSRFFRGLTPNVDYNTVGSAYDPRAEGGASLERAVSSVAFGGAAYGYSTVKVSGGKTMVTAALPLADASSQVIGIVLVRTSSGLAAKISGLLAPYYIFALLFAGMFAVLVITAFIRWRRRRMTMVQDVPAVEGDSGDDEERSGKEEPVTDADSPDVPNDPTN